LCDQCQKVIEILLKIRIGSKAQ